MNHQKEHGLKYQKLKKNEFSKNGHNSFLFSCDDLEIPPSVDPEWDKLRQHLIQQKTRQID